MAGETRLQKKAPGRPTMLMCPECNSMIFEHNESGAVRFRCREGHEFSAEQLCPGAEEQLRHAWANVVSALAL